MQLDGNMKEHVIFPDWQMEKEVASLDRKVKAAAKESTDEKWKKSSKVKVVNGSSCSKVIALQLPLGEDNSCKIHL